MTDHTPRRIAITGSTGMIGEALVSHLRGEGHTVHRVVRSKPTGDGDIYWRPSAGEIDADGFRGVDAVVHLAGAPISESRWTDEMKQKIRDSRVIGTTLLAETLAKLDDGPKVLVSGSAIGVYGDRGDEVLTEDSAVGPRSDFLADVVIAWESSTQAAETAGLRVCHARTGIVLSGEGGALGKMLPPFKAGIGGKIGPGTQYMSWISLPDEVRALAFLTHADLSGPVNIVGPQPVTNAEFTKALGKVLGRPTIFPIPGFGPKILYGEMGGKLTLDSQRVLPTKLQAAGFQFLHGDPESTLRAVLGR